MTESKNEADTEVLGQDLGDKTGNQNIMPARFVFPAILPILPLMNRPLFPKMMVPLSVEDDALKSMLTATAASSSKFVGLILAKNETENTGRPIPRKASELHSVGVIAEILQTSQSNADGSLQVMVGILERFKVAEVVSENPHIMIRPD